jgi:gamma-glutamyltranspeptidase/glutathione hydrolase
MPRIARFLVPICLIASLACPTRADEFTRHAVVAQEVNAARAGREILRRGGNAVDAAIATALALAVTHPAAGNLGGGGFMVVYRADSREVTTFDFREAAPGRSTPTMYLDEQGRLLPGHRTGPRAAGVPGTVRGLALAHERVGTMPWHALVEPAIGLARDGFAVSDELARSLNGELKRDGSPGRIGRMADFEASVAAYSKSDGRPWTAGDRLVQADLAATLARLAERGPDEFYTGKTADLLADYCASAGGLITRDDLAAYRAYERPPVHVRFRGTDVYGVGPPSSGGVVVAMVLRMLEKAPLESDPNWSDATVHRVAEAMRRAYMVRAMELGDPQGMRTSVDALLDDARLDQLAATFDSEHATPSSALAPAGVEIVEGEHTTHLSVVDGMGNAVALTYTLEDSYGSRAVVPGAGFLLNNEMGDFNLRPGRTDTAGAIGTERNRIVAGRRMLSSQAPTIVLQEGKLRLVTGSPGGRTIPNTVICVVLRVVAFGQPLDQAIGSPRLHHQWLPDRLFLEGTKWPESTVRALERRGHRVVVGGVQGLANSLEIEAKTGHIHAVADSRSRAAAAAGD